jgi:hypothetical protein
MAAPEPSKAAGSSSYVATIRADRAGKRCDALLDEALNLTFPASDPLAIEFAIAARDRQIEELAFAAGFEKGQRNANHPAELARRARDAGRRAAKAKVEALENARDVERRAAKAKVKALEDDARIGRLQRQRGREGGRISGERRRERSARSVVIRAARSRLSAGEPRQGLVGRIRDSGVTWLSERQIYRILLDELGPA